MFVYVYVHTYRVMCMINVRHYGDCMRLQEWTWSTTGLERNTCIRRWLWQSPRQQWSASHYRQLVNNGTSTRASHTVTRGRRATCYNCNNNNSRRPRRRRRRRQRRWSTMQRSARYHRHRSRWWASISRTRHSTPATQASSTRRTGRRGNCRQRQGRPGRRRNETTVAPWWVYVCNRVL